MRRRRSPERGATMVEAAIVTPVLVAMLFGIIEFGMMFKDYLGAQAMVRAGVRVASAAPRTTNFAQMAADEMSKTGTVIQHGNIQELWVYKANATDDFPAGFSSFSDCTTCVKFAWDYGANAFRPTTNTWAASSQNACTRAAGGPPDRIGVYVRVKHDSITGIIGPTTIAEGGALFLEPFPALQGCKP